MKPIKFKKLLTLTAAISLLSACENQSDANTAIDALVTADLVLKSGYVYTVDAARSVQEAVAIADGKILAVGSDADIAKYIGADTQVKDLEGKMVLPGLHDMHIHALASAQPRTCSFEAKPVNLDDMVPFLKDCFGKQDTKAGDWLIAIAWDAHAGSIPTETYASVRTALDEVSTTNPVVLWGFDGHGGAFNTAAFNLPETPINAKTLKTVYAEYAGDFSVDGEGKPTGKVLENGRLIMRPFMNEDLLGVYEDPAWLMPRVNKNLAASGITSLQDPIVTPEIFEHYKWLEDSGQMTFRMRGALLFEPKPEHAEMDKADIVTPVIAGFNELREKAKHMKYVKLDGAKIVADGVLDGSPYSNPPTMPNAAMVEGFKQPRFSLDPATGKLEVIGYVDTDGTVCKAVQADKSQYAKADIVAAFEKENGFFPVQCLKHFGKMLHREDVIEEYIKQATEAGYHLHVHGLGDKAVQVATKAFGDNKATADKLGLTQTIAHMQMAQPDDVKKLGELGAYVAFTYLWIGPTPSYHITVVPFLDEVASANDIFDEKYLYAQRAFPAKSILDAGGVPVFGSDAPVLSRKSRPFLNMLLALTRSGKKFDGTRVTLNPAEQLDIHETIASFTINSATLMQNEDTLGSIEAGKTADLIVINNNIVEAANSHNYGAIASTQVLTTIFDGKVIYEAPDTPPQTEAAH
ncbi:MAG: amidohydrolase family protein [Kordiimonadaceae bacterium]|nr:amidohydrolase family protein [Kordiimonadaceae bacterium]